MKYLLIYIDNYDRAAANDAAWAAANDAAWAAANDAARKSQEQELIRICLEVESQGK